MKTKSFRYYLITIGLLLGSLIPAISLFVLYKSRASVQSFSKVATLNLPSTRSLGQLLFRFRQIRIPVRSIPLQGNTSERVKEYIAETKLAIQEFEQEKDAFEKLVYNDTQKKLIEKLDIGWTEFKTFGGEVLKLGEAGDEQSLKLAANMIRDICPEKTKLVEIVLQQIIDNETANADLAVAQANTTDKEIRTISFLGIFIGFVFSIAIALISSSWMGKKLKLVSESLSQSSVDVKVATETLTHGSGELSESASHAASALEEAVSSLEEINSMVKLNSDRAVEAEVISKTCLETAIQTNAKSEELNASVKELANSSKKIEEIISLIDDISFQTNLLALNAAIEAARAGEHGKGFAVVAEAVRALAHKSSVAAKDISTLIEDSVSKTHKGDRLAKECQTAISLVIDGVQKMAQLNSEVAAANRESSTGLNQISKTMNQLDAATQKNAALAESSSETAQNLETQAKTLDKASGQLIEFLKGA